MSIIKDKNKFLKLCSLIFFTVLFLIVVAVLIFLYAEKNYYDKIFYKKSAIHGYTEKNILLGETAPVFIRHRNKDLYFLLGQNNMFFNLAKPDEFKIAVIGDSFSYGQGVRESQRFSNVLEKKLNKIRPTRVYNFSLPGDNLMHDYDKYMLAKEKLDIDLFVFGLVENDIDFASFGRYVKFEDYLNNFSRTCPKKVGELDWETVSGHSWEFLVKNYYFPFLSQVTYANYCIANQITQDLKDDNVLAVILQQYTDYGQHCDMYAGPGQQYEFSIILETYQDLFKNQGIDVLKVIDRPISSTSFELMHISDKEGHPSAIAHQEYAEDIYKKIIETKKWNF